MGTMERRPGFARSIGLRGCTTFAAGDARYVHRRGIMFWICIDLPAIGHGQAREAAIGRGGVEGSGRQHG